MDIQAIDPRQSNADQRFEQLLILGMILLSIVTGVFSWAFVEPNRFM